MSKSKRQHTFPVPEDLQHDPITEPENPITGHPVGTDTEVVTPVGVLRDIAEQTGLPVDESSFAAAEAALEAPVPPHRFDPITPAPYPTAQTEIKTMVQAKTEQRIYRCMYDDHALARKLDVGAKDPDVFCPVCGNRLVRER